MVVAIKKRELSRAERYNFKYKARIKGAKEDNLGYSPNIVGVLKKLGAKFRKLNQIMSLNCLSKEPKIRERESSEREESIDKNLLNSESLPETLGTFVFCLNIYILYLIN